jgi:hypothetical protein
MKALKGIPLLPGQTVFYRPIKNQPIIDTNSGYVFGRYYKKMYKNDIHHSDWRIQFAVDFATYQPGQRFYVKEQWEIPHLAHIQPARTMPESAARKFGVIEKVEVIDMQSISTEMLHKMGIRCGGCDHLGCGECDNAMHNKFKSDFIKKHGQQAWGENHYIFLFTVKIDGE